MATTTYPSDRRAAAPRGRRHVRSALIGLAVLPALAGTTAIAVLVMSNGGSQSPGRLAAAQAGAAAGEGALSGEVVIGLATIILAAAVVTVALLLYLLRPLGELTGARSNLELMYQQAREDSRHDGLTGLGNQRAFNEELATQFVLVEKHGDRFALVLMDLDDLKLVNDQIGHAAGDETLHAMADAMREVTRSGDRLFRLGGDEFAMLLPGASVETAVAITERLLHFARRPMTGARPSPFSAGISAMPLFGRDPAMLTRQADAALYWVKRHGRGAVEVFEPERDQLPDNQTDVARNAVQEVIVGRLLTPVFQPIVDLRTGRVLGFEGLIRPDPSGPLSDTTALFAAATMAGRTVELDVACIEQVLLAARAIGPDKLLTLNLSPRTLEVRDFDAGWLLQGLYRNGISPGRVIVELTERDEIDDLARLRQTFRHLREYGLRLAADDVGAGNSGLRLLSQVQFDIVKLDLSLVQDGTRRMGARSVLQSLRDLAIGQHAHVVAEGVETAAHLQVLRDLQIGAGQGYLLGRPGASVAATFVDVDQLGEERPVEVPAATPAAVFLPAALVAGAMAGASSSEAEWPRSDRLVAGHDLRAIVLPTARLGTLAGSSPGTA